MCGFDEKVVRNIKKGMIPGIIVLERIAEKHGISVRWLLGEVTVTATNRSMAPGNIIIGNNTQGKVQFQNPDILTVAKLIEQLEVPAATKVMIKKYEEKKQEMGL